MFKSLTPPHYESGKMRSVEAARALAAFAVVLMHAANLMRVEHFSGHIGLAGVFDFGYVGVDFFFVLSGFIITYVHFSEIGQVGRIPPYLWRRFSRIYPIFWVILLLSIAITTLGRFASGKGLSFDIAASDIAGTVFLLMGDGEPKYVGVAWSLQYEVVFYVAFCILLTSARVGAIAFGTWAIFLLARALGLVQIDLPIGLDSPHCLQFLLGVMVGAAARRYTLRTSLMTLRVVLLAFVATVLFEVSGPFGSHSAEGRIALGLASAAVLATLVALENGRAIATPAWLARMGSVSYSIYLGHILFINLTYMVLLKLGIYHALPEVVVFTIAISVALTTTTLIGRYIELPLVAKLKERKGAIDDIVPRSAVGR
ncbi:MAG: acyltransferase [Burkholderiaceae bacterium]|nr:MAG: acyltransferase [Burkholderiaceae bacterium]